MTEETKALLQAIQLAPTPPNHDALQGKFTHETNLTTLLFRAERAGLITWRGGWTITDSGIAALAHNGGGSP